MAVYAVGDIQGCYKPLSKLLQRVNFDSNKDRLWCVGDLVNRGPDSLTTLRFLQSLGDACICVLGNHDFHLLSMAAGGQTYAKDTMDDILNADDCDALIEWLRFRPLLHHDSALNWCMVHAGIHPKWSLEKAKQRAREVEIMLQGSDWKGFCQRLAVGEFPEQNPEEEGLTNKIFTVAVMTRTRHCSQAGIFDWKHKSEQVVAAGFRPWFAHETLGWKKDTRVLFGHWAARGLIKNEQHVLGLDSGCVWGGELTLARLDLPSVAFISEPCQACHRID